MTDIRTFWQLMSHQARAAVRVSGADHSSWNGQVAMTLGSAEVGVANWDGSLEYSEAWVAEPLQDLFRNASWQKPNQERLEKYRLAVLTVLHENVHLLAAAGTEHEDSQEAFQRPGVRVLVEGVTEVYSGVRLNAYIDELGLEKFAPGLRSTASRLSYPQYTPAAEIFANTIGRRSGVDGDEVLRRMAIVHAGQAFRVAAETTYDGSDLPRLVPQSEREGALRRIEAAMEPPFEAIEKLAARGRGVRRQSSKAGLQAAQAGFAQVRILEKEWGGRTVEPARQLSQQRVPREVPRDGSSRDGSVRAAPGPAGPGGPSRKPQDVQHAVRVGLSGSPALTDAQRLPENRQGSRQGAVPSGPQPQGPDRSA